MAEPERRMFRRPTSHYKSVHISQEVLEARFKRFDKDFAGYERRCQFEDTMECFLGLYREAVRSTDFRVQYRLVALLFELKRLNPEFRGEVVFNARQTATSTKVQI